MNCVGSMIPPKARPMNAPELASLAAPQQPVVRGLPALAPSASERSVPPSFRAIYDEHFAFVWRLAANRGIPARALEDVAQEVFIVVHRKLPEFEGRSSLRTWIAAIVRRVVADYVKKRGNRAAGDESLTAEPLAGVSPAEQAEQLERKLALELLDSLLAKMTSDQREVFVLHELEHMSGAEIAALTASNENTVWTRLRAARRIFQEGVARQQARRRAEQP
jgi:RNA polymerase sigma-70 factor, ECF subfamily